MFFEIILDIHIYRYNFLNMIYNVNTKINIKLYARYVISI